MSIYLFPIIVLLTIINHVKVFLPWKWNYMKINVSTVSCHASHWQGMIKTKTLTNWALNKEWYVYWLLSRCESRSNKEMIKHLATLDRLCQSIQPLWIPLPWQPPANNTCTGLYEGKRATICDNISIITVTNGAFLLLYLMWDQTCALISPSHTLWPATGIKKSSFCQDINDTS